MACRVPSSVGLARGCGTTTKTVRSQTPHEPLDRTCNVIFVVKTGPETDWNFLPLGTGTRPHTASVMWTGSTPLLWGRERVAWFVSTEIGLDGRLPDGLSSASEGHICWVGEPGGVMRFPPPPLRCAPPTRLSWGITIRGHLRSPWPIPPSGDRAEAFGIIDSSRMYMQR